MEITTADLERLHTALNYLCPTGKEQQSLTEIRNEIQQDGHNNAYIAVSMMGYITDGLRHGNW